jgi:hypothetical protein
MIGNYLFGEDGTTNTQQSDFYMLGFYNPDKSFDILNYMHMQLINNWESHSSYEGYPRGPDAKSVLNSTAFTKLETTTQKGVVNWLNNLSDVCIALQSLPSSTLLNRPIVHTLYAHREWEGQSLRLWV